MKHDIHVETEALNIIQQHMKFVIIGISLSGITATFALWNTLNHLVITFWLALILIMNLARYLNGIFKYSSMTLTQKKYYLVIGSLISGTLWAALTIIVSFQTIDSSMGFITVLVACTASVALVSHSSYPPAYYAYAIPTMGGISISFLIFNNEISVVSSFLAFLYLMIMIFFSQNIYKSTIEMISLKIKNEELLHEVRSQAKIADEKNIRKSIFLSRAIAEINPLFSRIKNQVDKIKSQNQAADINQSMEEIITSTNALERFSRQLKSLSVIDGNQIRVNISEFKAQELLNPIIEEFDQKSALNNLAFRACENDIVLNTDFKLCGEIISNVIENAIEHTQSGSIELVIEPQNKFIDIIISDTGEGVDNSEINNIFSEQLRISSKKHYPYNQIGLGLPICKRLCELLNIKIYFDSILNKGSSIKLSIPKA